MQVFNLKLDGGDGACRGGRKETCRGVVGVKERERGKKKTLSLEQKTLKNRAEKEIPKIVELILLFTVVKLVSLSVQRPILPFL